MSEVEVYKLRLERTVKIQMASEGRPYGRKDVLDSPVAEGVPVCKKCARNFSSLL